ncbi:MAG: tRNA pseudouridine(55) synthase TruB [Rhodospirillaceae bacterium]|nr:tRNA pseudouridine(55) synthase TruB [Rhodospirillaceae bacterium]
MAQQLATPHGLIVLNKPVGLSSAKAVGIIRRFFGGAKTGHAGTLDPLACGVLPIAVGEATKTISYVATAEKSYQFTVRWGAETQTDDSEGEITRTSEYCPSGDEIKAILPQFTGLIQQVPPIFSAVKVKGRRAYVLARDRRNPSDKSADIVLNSREVMINKFEITVHAGQQTTFAVRCGKGTYIRALARDIGRALGSAAHVVFLQRRAVGRFKIEDAIELDFFEKGVYDMRAHDYVIPIMTVLDDIPALAITEQEAQKLRFGQTLDLDDDRSQMFLVAAKDGDQTAPVTGLAAFGKRPIAFVRLENRIVSPVRVLNL